MMFKLYRSILGVVCVYVLWLTAETSANTKLSSCSFQLNNGSVINLKMVAASIQDAPRFKDIKAKNKEDHSLYYYNPCYTYVYPPGTQGMPCSENVAVCVGTTEGYFNIGTQDSAIFVFNETTQQWMISYYNPSGDRQTNVSLQCSDSMNHTLDVWGLTNGTHKSEYRMTLTSLCACADGCGTPILPHGMSMGSFLLLLLLVFVTTYLLVGYLYRRCVIGARGIELLPHLHFWMDFPFLVQDGFFFLIKCGQNDNTYERI